jgi:GNAT superfamily N-acetyltransferase
MPPVEVITTFLEMLTRPSLVVTRPNRSGMLLRLQEPTVPFYRFLYDAIGARWGWTERAAMSDGELLEVISDELVEIFVLYMGGVPAGSFELDRRVEGQVELRHFGLVPDFIGRGLGKHLLASAVDAAWDHEPDRVWVRSTNLEHPRGLLTYQWAGFVPYESTRESKEDPRRP